MKTKDIQIAFFDVDGTLVNPKTGCISQKTRETLLRLHEKGIKLYLATGRPPASLPDLTGIYLDGFITVNGSLCYTHDTILSHNPIPPENVQKVIQNAAALGRPVSVATRDQLAANGWDDDLADYYRLAGVELTVTEDFDAVCQENIYQIMLGCRKQDHPAILCGAEGVEITFSWDRAADVIPTGSGKASAILTVLNHYHLTPAQAIAFGDGFNDLEMLKTAGTGVAMGNASPALKEAADDVCDPVWDEGIYHYCLRHELI